MLRKLLSLFSNNESSIPQEVATTPVNYSEFFIVFLDFDGVLHQGTSGTFRHVPLLETIMHQYPQVRIVISSSWKQMYSVEDLKEWFPSTMAERILGATPTLTPYTGQPSRQREIEQWCATHSVSYFCVLDDDAQLFEVGWPPLILTDGKTGLTTTTTRELVCHIERALPPV